MVICAIFGCSEQSAKNSGVRFFSIPAILRNQCSKTLELSTRRRALWIKRINRKNLQEKDVKQYTRVCSKHFRCGKPAYLFDDTNPDWAPCMQLGYQDLKVNSSCSIDRYHRAIVRQDSIGSIRLSNTESDHPFELMKEEEDLEEVSSLNEKMRMLENKLLEYEEKVDILHKDLDDRKKKFEARERELLDQIKLLTSDNEARLQESQILKKKVPEMTLDEANLVGKDAKVKFYTGVPTLQLLMHVFNLVQDKVTSSSQCTLSKFQELLIFMMRLRLGLTEQDLGYRFDIHQSTVSRICDRWLEPMSYSLEKLILWPEREILYKTMPLSFQTNFGKSVAVIVDCFEVFIDRPTSLVSRAGTWSQYKHHNTIKFLIGITPHGTISFISKAWVGRTSDKHLTENCGILDNLLPGDVVLADRGFNIEDSVRFTGAKLNIPAFTKGKPQLSYNDIDATRKIANVRIHVERVIGLVRRKYKILGITLPVELLTTKPGNEFSPVDHIARVCCALVNLCPPIVPME